MRVTPTRNRLYGFEDCLIYSIDCDYFFDSHASKYWFSTRPETGTQTYLFNTFGAVANSYGNVVFNSLPYKDHPELLETAKKVFVHKDCKISRTLISEKYKKSLSPFTADAVIVPEFDSSVCGMYNNAVFINEDCGVIGKVFFHKPEHQDFFNANKGKTLRDLLQPHCVEFFEEIHGLLDATLEYVGGVISIPNEGSPLLDILTNTLPKDKTVFEKTMQNSLGTEENKITFENIISIHEMLKSSDENTKAAGMKALSMMDYMHYPNSVKLMFHQMNTWEWRYNKANSSTSVKFMLKSIFGDRWRRWWGDYNKTIYPQDLELFKKLLVHYEKLNDEDFANRMAALEFMKVNAEGMLVPVLEA